MGFMFYIWIMVLIVTILIEISTTDLTSIWFSVGSIGALISSIFLKNDFIYLQILIFALISIISIFTLRPIIKKRFNSEKVATNVDAMLGSKVLVVEKIEPNIPGAVKAEGVEWTAICTDGSFIPGDFVEVCEIKGNTLTIKKI